ncbi:MAG TPA: hypothetical protein VHB54_10775 [Mucilaginibacter sp.]|nr:hypothetical protein [Mucilaginibacter sp.]HVW14301.1 hypothetical protein [Mucilaginibacter sp.]
MQLSKEKLQHFVNNMPEKIDVLELIDKVILMAKIDQASDGPINQYTPQDDLEKEIDLWG